MGQTLLETPAVACARETPSACTNALVLARAVLQLVAQRRERLLLAPGWLMGAWHQHGRRGYWHVPRPHAVMAHMVGSGGAHQHGKKLAFKVRLPETTPL